MTPPSELAWRSSDYLKAGAEVPDRLLDDPSVCEGELMSADEIEEYLADGLRALMILRDKKSEHYERIRQDFQADLDFLLKIGRIDEEQYNELTDEQSYQLPGE